MNFKIGILGGLFDPPHIGHLIIAQYVLEEFKLKRVIFVPAYNPPHKARYSPFPFRLRMTHLAIKGNKKFLVSDIESSINGKTYTVEVIKALKKIFHSRITLPASRNRNDDPELYLIIGADQWNEIETWRSPEELFRECRIIVVRRPGYEINRKNFHGKKLLMSSSPLIEISSTVIRDRIRGKRQVDYYIPPAVLSYISRCGLYR